MTAQEQNKILFDRELNNHALIDRYRVACQSISNQEQVAYLWDVADHRIDSDTYFEILKSSPFVIEREIQHTAKIRRRIEADNGQSYFELIH